MLNHFVPLVSLLIITPVCPSFSFTLSHRSAWILFPFHSSFSWTLEIPDLPTVVTPLCLSLSWTPSHRPSRQTPDLRLEFRVAVWNYKYTITFWGRTAGTNSSAVVHQNNSSWYQESTVLSGKHTLRFRAVYCACSTEDLFPELVWCDFSTESQHFQICCSR